MDFPCSACGSDRDVVHISGKGGLTSMAILHALHLFLKKGARKGHGKFAACDDGARNLNGRAANITELDSTRAEMLRQCKGKIMKWILSRYGPGNKLININSIKKNLKSLKSPPAHSPRAVESSAWAVRKSAARSADRPLPQVSKDAVCPFSHSSTESSHLDMIRYSIGVLQMVRTPEGLPSTG